MAKSMHRSLQAKIASLEGPEWDSSDEEEDLIPDKIDFIDPHPTDVDDDRNQDSVNPAKAKNELSSKSGVKTSTSPPPSSQPSSIIYLGHIPKNFEEDEILSFLQQFGKVKHVKLSRSRKSGRPKGYAFVEFCAARDGVEVASIVADTLSGYFLSGRRLVCHVLSKDMVHSKLFAGVGKKGKNLRNLLAKGGVHRKRVRESEKAFHDADTIKKRTKTWHERNERKRRKLKNLGISYDIPGYSKSDERGVATDITGATNLIDLKLSDGSDAVAKVLSPIDAVERKEQKHQLREKVKNSRKNKAVPGKKHKCEEAAASGGASETVLSNLSNEVAAEHDRASKTSKRKKNGARSRRSLPAKN